ncbi:hypothetical protein DFA_02810 [Cavenderia fasciculata]|uniref:IPT/TIG domain-containing protein n=1 Tax=Cavenderia fasciculata TaxID=261658 RepID=F4PID3_CACFS|nr:uncharacterized protein DFA_02810 [Cavenderia fasciculata]EGG24567.1 hypothetical protein DFA_02810 [Cavenderia fasciculata]|eukprot:XP_004362418.1 hypothetical protein DFA_02810 [Cavenderia fasciculata]
MKGYGSRYSIGLFFYLYTIKQVLAQNVIYNIHDRTVTILDETNMGDVNNYVPLIAFYSTDAPIIDSVTNIIPGMASMVTINGDHFGKDSSYVLISMNGKQCKPPRFVGNGHGVCNRQFGSCQCDSGYNSYLDCLAVVTPNQQYNTTVGDNGTSTLSTNDTSPGIVTNFTTRIQLREINLDHSIIQTISMDNITLELLNHSSTGESIFIGTMYNQPTKIQVNVNQYIDTNTSSFLGEDIQVPSNSIKYTIKIIDWVWSSPINTLQVIFHSKSDSVVYDKCGVVRVKSEVSPGDQIV